jgi:hypothetical protein
MAKDLKPVRNVKPLWSKARLLMAVSLGGLRHVDQQPLGFLVPVRHDAPRQIRRRRHRQGEEASSRSTTPSPMAC